MDYHVPFCMKMKRMREEQSWKGAEEEKKVWRGEKLWTAWNGRNCEKLPLCIRGSGGITPVMLSLGTKCRYVVSFPFRPL
jgi:hypothetical protein